MIRAVLFDFDGTLTEPGALDFAVVRKAVGCPDGSYILEHIARIPAGPHQDEARRALNAFELDAASQSRANADAEELVTDLRRQSVKLGILSRNHRGAILRALENFGTVNASDFEIIISRDEVPVPKPSPAAVHLAADRMGVSPQDMLVVGDFEFDIEAGRSAGAITAFLTNGGMLQCRVPADHTIATIGEVADIVQLSRPLAQGKLPNRWLQLFLREMEIVDPSLLIPPGVGEDVAAVDAGGEEVLVLKSDPVTFVTDDAASYAITVNANDIATSGGTPRWLLVSLMFPPGSTATSVRSVMSALARQSRLQGLVLCGGHTEITDAVTRPVIVGSVVGTVRRERLIRKGQMRPGDRLLITKAIAIEGTCIIAREFPHKLREAGMSEEDIERCRSLLRKPGLSIVTEARLAADSGKVTAMHDITEGGLATALLELGAAGGHRLRIDSRRIPILEETRRICGVLGLNPLGLIGSGSLLICCAPDACEHLIQKVRQSGIGIECIGEVLEAGCGIEPSDGETWPDFEVDEITRLFETASMRRGATHGA